MATMTLSPAAAARPAARAAQASALLAAAAHEFDARRALALVALACAGLDASELVALDVASVCDLAAAGWWGYHITTRSGVRVPITADTYALLVDLLCRTGRLGEPAAPLFLSRRQHRLSTKQVRRILASVADRAGVTHTAA